MTRKDAVRRHQQLSAQDHHFLWHPFTPMESWLSHDPIIIEKGDGAWLTDTTGRRFLDGVSSLWVNVHGHRHPALNSAVEQQLNLIAHSTLLGLSNVPAVELAERLISVAPEGLTRVFYSDNGSTAVEVALKMAFQYWRIRGEDRRREFVALENAYHGDTLGSVSVGGIEQFHTLFRPLLFPVHHVPSPHVFRSSDKDPVACKDRCVRALERLFAQRAANIAAMVIEPLVQGAAGIIVHPTGYLEAVATLCKEHDVLLICDEVATGFGRTGTLFACQQEGVHPDFMALAKGLTGGYLPVAATLTTNRIFETFRGADPMTHTFFHGHTYTGNPLGCAAALANLEVFDREQVLMHLAPKIDAFTELLHRHIGMLPLCGDIRQKGFMVGIELVQNRDTNEPFPPDALTGARVCAAARHHGILIRPLGDVVVLMPPLNVSVKDLETLTIAISKAIMEVTEAESVSS